jgi:ectoine hydroxylase-related dioxygenase (phytanoyl-CoA dioxygenase family)
VFFLPALILIFTSGTAMTRYDSLAHQRFADQVREDGIAILPGHFSAGLVKQWAAAFAPLLAAQLADHPDENRGAHRHYVTLPFNGVFADPAVFADPDIVAIVNLVVGPKPVMCQLAADTPLRGSDYQPLHRDADWLFPETALPTPPFQLAVNFPLCDVTLENGPFETTRGSQNIDRARALAMIESGELPLEQIPMKMGDVMIRDVRPIHRGTPNRTDTARPMVVMGYSRSWLMRPEVHIDVPRAVLEALAPEARELLRLNPVCEGVAAAPAAESYRNFMY